MNERMPDHSDEEAANEAVEISNEIRKAQSSGESDFPVDLGKVSLQIKDEDIDLELLSYLSGLLVRGRRSRRHKKRLMEAGNN